MKVTSALLMASVLYASPAFSIDHSLKFGTSLPIVPSESSIDSMLRNGSAFLKSKDSIDDTSCDIDFERDGHVQVLTNIPTSLLTNFDWQTFSRNGQADIFIVNSIQFCTSPVPPGIAAAGCAAKNGPMVLSRQYLTPVVMSHEFGHFQGRARHHPDIGYLMYAQALSENNKVEGWECDLILRSIANMVLSGEGETPDNPPELGQPEPPQANPRLSVDDLLNSVWMHGIPYESISDLTDEALDQVREALQSEDRNARANAVIILGLRGSEIDIPAIRGIFVDADSFERNEIAIINAPYALSYLFNRTNEASALQPVRDLMVEPSKVLAPLDLPEYQISDLQNTAILAFSYAGPEAEKAFPTAIAEAQIGLFAKTHVAASDEPTIDDLYAKMISKDLHESPLSRPSVIFDQSVPASEREVASDSIERLQAIFSSAERVRAAVNTDGLPAVVSGDQQ